MESIKSLTFYDKLLSAQYYKASQKFSKEKDLLSVTWKCILDQEEAELLEERISILFSETWVKERASCSQ